jgi:hypothetical protein
MPLYSYEFISHRRQGAYPLEDHYDVFILFMCTYIAILSLNYRQSPFLFIAAHSWLLKSRQLLHTRLAVIPGSCDAGT